jgi:hypothetical protein
MTSTARSTGERDAGLLDRSWHMQAQWSRLADVKKRRVARGRIVALALIVLAATLGALSASTATGHPLLAKGLAATAAVCAALLPLLRPLYTGRQLVDFTIARQVAENIKSLVITWLALNGGAASTAETRELHQQVLALRLLAPELIVELDELPADSPLPAITDLDSYLELRIREQMETYYRRRARQIDRTLLVFDRCSFGLGVLGALLGALAVFWQGVLAGWIAVVTTVATAVSAHIAASHYRFQQLQFIRTAEQLEQLVLAATGTPAPPLAEVVAEGEAVILGENRAWQTTLSKPGGTEPDQATA